MKLVVFLIDEHMCAYYLLSMQLKQILKRSSIVNVILLVCSLFACNLRKSYLKEKTLRNIFELRMTVLQLSMLKYIIK